MSRLTKIEGKFMGVKFEVKPTPLMVDKIEKELRDMMIGWYKENEPEIADEVENGLKTEGLTNKELADKIEKMNAWKYDVEFRAEFLKKKAEACMDFKGNVPDDAWKSEDIEISTIQEAWDFFCGNRMIPQDGLQAR